MPDPNIDEIEYPKAGLPPGTLVYIGKQNKDAGLIKLVRYDKDTYHEKTTRNIEECSKFLKKPGVKWINVYGLHKIQMIERFGKEFDLHPILLEDVVNTQHIPKMDDYDDHLFIVLKSLCYNKKKKCLDDEQISIVLGKDFIITFQERKPDTYLEIRRNLRNNRGRMRRMGADYLAYVLSDYIVDMYFVLLEKLGDEIELLEDEVTHEPTQNSVRKIQELKKNVMYIRKIVWPMRDVVSKLTRRESPLVSKGINVYLGDLHDHVMEVINTVETFREALSSMVEIYMYSISNKTNEIMKVLAVFSTIFMPLTFITGIYGMNFMHMPELGYEYGYYFAICAMGIIAVTMLSYYRSKKWI